MNTAGELYSFSCSIRVRRLLAALVVALGLPALGWAQAAPLGTEFRVNTYTLDRQDTARVCSAAGGAEEAKILLIGKRDRLSMPAPVLRKLLTAPVTVQLVNSDSAVCWEAVYSSSNVTKDEVDEFKAKF